MAPRCYVITHERSGTHMTINLLIKGIIRKCDLQDDEGSGVVGCRI